MEPDDQSPTSTEPSTAVPFKTMVRTLLIVYLITLPACTRNAGHFGPGFFPLVAALFLVPLFAIVAFGDAASEWLHMASSARESRKWWPAVLMSLVAAGYCTIIVMVVAEKMHR